MVGAVGKDAAGVAEATAQQEGAALQQDQPGGRALDPMTAGLYVTSAGVRSSSAERSASKPHVCCAADPDDEPEPLDLLAVDDGSSIICPFVYHLVYEWLQ